MESAAIIAPNAALRTWRQSVVVSHLKFFARPRRSLCLGGECLQTVTDRKGAGVAEDAQRKLKLGHYPDCNCVPSHPRLIIRLGVDPAVPRLANRRK